MKKRFVVVIAILCIIGIMCAFVACQKNGGESGQPSGQPSGNAPSGGITDSGSIDSGDTIPSGSVDSGEITSGNQQPSGDAGDKEDLPSGTIPPSGEITSGEVGSGEVNSGEPQPEEPITNAEIISALENYCYTAMANKLFLGMDVDLNNITSGAWYLIKDNLGNIEGAEYTCYYQSSERNTYYTVGKVLFENAVKDRDLVDGNIGKATYSRAFRTNFDPTIQADRAALTNAICDKLFGENPNAIRYIVDKGTFANDEKVGDSRVFNVIEIFYNHIKEYSINIKYASTDEKLILYIESNANYRTYNENSYTLSGTLITQ